MDLGPEYTPARRRSGRQRGDARHGAGALEAVELQAVRRDFGLTDP
jgi:hypothetical protein